MVGAPEGNTNSKKKFLPYKPPHKDIGNNSKLEYNHTCVMCNKPYTIYLGRWIYHSDVVCGTTYYFCGWNCQMAYERAEKEYNDKMREGKVKCQE